MDARFGTIAAIAASQHSVISLKQLDSANVTQSLRHHWVHDGLLDRLGPRSFAVAGSDPTWMRSLVAGFLDVEGRGVVAGRSAARLHGLDGFIGDHVELLVPRKHRDVRSQGIVRSTTREVGREDLQNIDCLRVVRAERLILDSPLFGFSREETENAIDSALRKRLVSEQSLRSKAIDRHSPAINGGRILLDALVDSGGESRLERWFLRLVRDAGLARPVLQKTFRADTRIVARVDAFFTGGLVVELAGHGTHATRRQRQGDAQRHTELTLRGLRVLTFTYEDVRDRPTWVIARLREALGQAA
jgi:very-short-patch-repair endonuclease